MSFVTKDNGREYSNRINSNPNKMQSMNNRNINLSQQYSNSNNVENYSYETKGQRGCNSPKQNCEMHNNNPQNTNPREHYPYKNENTRTRRYPSKYSNDRPTYYLQQSNSPTDVVIPEIDMLKEFIREQSEHFKSELNKYEECKSSLSPRSNYYQDQGQQGPQQRLTTSQNRNTSCMSTSNSLGTISCSNSNFSNLSFASTAMSNLDKQSNNYQNKSNYNKTVQSVGKPNNLTRNLSHDETFSKAPPINKNRVGSPNNSSEKSPGNKTQFINNNISNTGGGIRQDSKPDMNKLNKYSSYNFGTGNHYQTSQQNTNNQVTVPSYANKINQQVRVSSMNASVGCPKNTSPNSYETHKNSARINGDAETGKPHRVEVRVPDNSRHMSNSGNTTDSQDVEYGTPDSPVSPCSLRFPQTDEIRNGITSRQTNNKKGQ